MQDFTKLVIWQRARRLAANVYQATRKYPAEEMYRLTGQTRGAALSVTANIAEGAGRGSNADFARMLKIARGEASELQSHLLIAGDVGLLPEELQKELVGEVVEVRRMISGLITSLAKKITKDD